MEQHQTVALVICLVAITDFLVLLVLGLKKGGFQGLVLGLAGIASALLMFSLAAGFYFQILGLS